MATRTSGFGRVAWTEETDAASAARDIAEMREAAGGRPRLAYLTNVYPKISHSFIRTEIAALERCGFAVDRFTIRKAADLPIDDEDRDEAERTAVLLDGNRAGLALDVARCLARRPGATLSTLVRALRERPGPGVPGLIRACAYFAEAAALAIRLERLGVRHVHVHFGTNPVTVARLASRLAPISYSFTVHGPDEFDAPLGLDLPGKIADAAFVVAVSSFGRGQLMRWSDPAGWDRIHVVRCAVAPRFLAAPAVEPATRRLLCVARLGAQKGIPLLVEAAARLASRPDLTIDIIGDGELRPAIEARIDELGLAGRVHLLGWRAPEEVQQALARACAFVLPSFAEGLPVVLMEALAMGRPVIATAIAGIPELVDAETGWLIPSGSVDALAEALEAVLDTPPQQLHAMGLAGQARVQAFHHPDTNGRALAELLAPFA